MNTVEKFKKLEREYRNNHKVKLSDYLSIDDLHEAVNALERATPKRPFFERSGRTRCPYCAARIDLSYQSFCLSCGQRVELGIDTSELFGKELNQVIIDEWRKRNESDRI